MDEISLRGKIFHQGLLSLENSFPFPSECPLFPRNEGFERNEFMWLEGKFMTFPRKGKRPSSHFSPQKMLWGSLPGRRGCNSLASPWSTCMDRIKQALYAEDQQLLQLDMRNPNDTLEVSVRLWRNGSAQHLFWETDFLPLLVLTRRGRSTGKNQYWW